ncbi:unnamed protein product [Diplocarpon coronariae]|nr:hypothetical protein JHW43_002227 [Diplocarpon mali]
MVTKKISTVTKKISTVTKKTQIGWSPELSSALRTQPGRNIVRVLICTLPTQPNQDGEGNANKPVSPLRKVHSPKEISLTFCISIIDEILFKAHESVVSQTVLSEGQDSSEALEEDFGADATSSKRHCLTTANLQIFNNITGSRRPPRSDYTVTATKTSTSGSISSILLTTAPGFAEKVFENGVLKPTCSGPASNVANLREMANRQRTSDPLNHATVNTFATDGAVSIDATFGTQPSRLRQMSGWKAAMPVQLINAEDAKNPVVLVLSITELPILVFPSPYERPPIAKTYRVKYMWPISFHSHKTPVSKP